MNNIGNTLQEARSRLGYSIREVADVIHVRAEYIAQIEENTFEIPLHSVYVRGFVRLYAKYLKLDPDEIVDGYNKKNAQIEFTTEVASERESFGTYTVNEDEQEIIDPEPKNPFERYQQDDEPQRPPWLYPIGIALVVILIFTAIFMVKITFFPTSSNPDTHEISTEAGREQQSGFSISSLDNNLIELIASAPLYVFVEQTIDKEILYSGTLTANERKTIIREGEIKISCDLSENLTIKKGGIPQDLQGRKGGAKFIIE